MTNQFTATLSYNPQRIADTALKTAARFWFLTAVIGQWIFVYFIVAFYGGAYVQGDFEAVNNKLIHGFIPGDTMGNFAVAMHLLLATIITLGGPIQLIPWVRTQFPFIHYWNGRLYMLTAFMISLDGLYMVLTRGTIGGLVQHFAVSLNAVLIMIFAAVALHFAIARKIDTHRRWALRLFLVVSGVWFFRVGLMLWILLNGGPVGFDPKTFTGPFLTFLAFAQYFLPLAVLELYFHTQDRASASGRFAMALGLFILTALMGVGIFGATMGMWLPKI